MEKFEFVNDTDGIKYRFTGEEIGFSSSGHHGTPRWMEITIYKTDTNKYIVHSVGCSDVYHQMHTFCSSGEPVMPTDLDDTNVPCSKCKPNAKTARYVRREVDLSNVFVCDTQQGVVESLMAKDRDGVLHLPRTSVAALDSAGISRGTVTV